MNEKKKMRRLSLRQANNCENAVGSHCRCRCGGVLHGAKRRQGFQDAEVFYALLPENDPHFRPLATPEKQQALLQRIDDIPF